MVLSKKHWKTLTYIPIVIVLLSLALLINNTIQTGFFIERDVELSGGKQISFEIGNVNTIEITERFPFSRSRVSQGVIKSLLIEIPFEEDEDQVIDFITENFEVIGEPSIRNIGPALGKIFWKQTQIAFIVALVSMSVIVFLLFRSKVPSGLVILAAFSDVVITVTVLSLLGVNFSLPILAALLMILGYSVDTNILLTNHMLKTKEGFSQAFKTGMTMSFTTIFVLLTLYIFSGSFVLQQISLALFIGLVADIPITWLTNAGLLKMWMDKRLDQ